MTAEHLLMTLREPHVSEKSTLIADKYGQITFKVLPSANKIEIKKAVEEVFKVKVNKVSIVNVKGKKKRFKQMTGTRRNWKKAIVSLQDGSDIDFTMNE